MVGYTINTFLSVIHSSIGDSLQQFADVSIYNETHFPIAHGSMSG